MKNDHHTTPTFSPKLTLLLGTSTPIKSQYYQQLSRYVKQVLKVINNNPTSDDLIYYNKQLELSKKEMYYYQDKFFAMHTATFSQEEAYEIMSKPLSDY